MREVSDHRGARRPETRTLTQAGGALLTQPPLGARSEWRGDEYRTKREAIKARDAIAVDKPK